MAFNASASGYKFVYAFGNQEYQSDIFWHLENDTEYSYL